VDAVSRRQQLDFCQYIFATPSPNLFFRPFHFEKPIFILKKNLPDFLTGISILKF